MLDNARFRFNRWALQTLGRDWLDYIASNTMTDFNRSWNDFLWTYDLKALVIAVHEEAPGVKTFTLMPNQLWKGAKPGQYISVHASVAGERLTRFYSLSPMQNHCFTITVKRVAGGKVSNWLHDTVVPGLVLDIGQAQGHFCYQQQRKVLFIAAGSGITPVFSLVTAMVTAKMQGEDRPDIAVYAQFARAEDMIFKSTLPQWQADGIPVTVSLSQEPPGSVDIKPLIHSVTPIARLQDGEALVRWWPDLHERDIYLCGPQGFMDAVIELLRNSSYDLKRLHCERFVAPVPHALSPADFATDTAEIHFRHLDRHITLTPEDQGLTLMQIAERHEIPIETGCRQGMCGTCKLTLAEGAVSGNQLGHAVYLCSAYPASNVLVLDA